MKLILFCVLIIILEDVNTDQIVVCKQVDSSEFKELTTTNQCSASVLFVEETSNNNNTTNKQSSLSIKQDFEKLKDQIQEIKNRSLQIEKLKNKLKKVQEKFKAFKACSSNPCVNGNCSYSNNTYLCSCNPGYTGRNCEIGCGTNAICTNTLTNFTCVCNQDCIASQGICRNCKQPLGLENGKIPDSRITASSIWDDSSEPYRARLNNKGTATSRGAWIPKGNRINGSVYNLHFDPPGTMWIQVQLVPQQYVTGIITQGRPDTYDQYITSYNIEYSDDGVNFTSIPGTFKGNNDSHTPITEYFPKPILTSYIRLYPMTWVFSPTLRMELLGCNQ